MQRAQIGKWLLGVMMLALAVGVAGQALPMDRDRLRGDDPRSLSPTTRGLEGFLPEGHKPQPVTGFGDLLGEWTWAEIGVPSRYDGAGLAIDYPYLYLCNQGNDSVYVVDISSGVPESVEVSFEAPGGNTPWGAGVDNDAELWIGVTNDSLDHEYSAYPPAPSPTGNSFSNWQGNAWMADMSDNFPGDTVFQLRVGGDNSIYAFHEPTGTVGRSFGDPAWTFISQRGLTYNGDRGTFLVGGWNSGHIWEISYADGAPVPGLDFAPTRVEVSGLAYQDSAYDGTAKLWVQMNSEDDYLQLYDISLPDSTLIYRDENSLPRGAFSLLQNSPNPFGQSTIISYSLPVATNATLSVYDATGSLVETLVAGRQGPGVLQARWDARGHTDGIYFYRLQAGNLTDTRKMVLVR